MKNQKHHLCISLASAFLSVGCTQLSHNSPVRPSDSPLPPPSAAPSANALTATPPARAAKPAAPSLAKVPPRETPPPAPSSGAPYYYTSVPATSRVLALTFDDGPHPTLTPRLLDILKAHNARATFYVIGRNVAAHPAIAARIVAEGHEIANHSWSHPNLSVMSDGAVLQELSKTNDIIRNVTGVAPKTFRPPYGAFSMRQRVMAYEKLGLPSILWSVDPLDWKIRSAPSVRSKLVSGAHPGGILLAHDIHLSTIEAMPGTLSDLSARGYRFVTVTELLALADEFAAAPQNDPIAAAPADAR